MVSLMSQQAGQLLPCVCAHSISAVQPEAASFPWADGTGDRCLSYDSRMPHLAGIFQISLWKLFTVCDPGHRFMRGLESNSPRMRFLCFQSVIYF